jgi:hypothetical protein
MNGLQFDWSQLYAVADLTPNEQEMVESAWAVEGNEECNIWV